MTVNEAQVRYNGLGNRNLLIYGTALLLVLAVLLFRYRANPRDIGLGSDSGLFAYGGQQILDGAVLYQDVWDTKPPGVFYINALAQALGGGGPWSLWAIETLWVAAAMLALLFLLGYLFGWLPAAITALVVTLTALYPGYVEGGNFTETWALLPLVLILAFAVSFFRSQRSIWLVVIGFLTAFVMFLKPTYVALGAAFLIVTTVSAFQAGNRRTAWSQIALFTAGFLPLVLVALVYWAANGALPDLWNAVIRQNVSYVQEGLSLRSIYGTGRRVVLEQPMATLSALTIASLAIFLTGKESGGEELSSRPTGKSRESVKRGILIVAFLSLPIEIAFIAISGRNFGHYFLTPLPAMAVAIAYLFFRMAERLAVTRKIASWFAVSVVMVGMLLFAWTLTVLPDLLPSRGQVTDLIDQPFTTGYFHDDLELYVIKETDPEESVLVWGYNPRLHFITQRQAPSRFLFHAQLLTPGPVGEARFDQFLNDIERDPPALIFAQPQSQHSVPFFGAADDQLCPNCTDQGLADLRQLREFVEEGYELESIIEDWLIYRRKAQA